MVAPVGPKYRLPDILGAAGRGGQAGHDPHLVFAKRVQAEFLFGQDVLYGAADDLQPQVVFHSACQYCLCAQGALVEHRKHAGSELSEVEHG